MKKILILFILTLVLITTGCTNKTTNKVNTTKIITTKEITTNQTTISIIKTTESIKYLDEPIKDFIVLNEAKVNEMVELDLIETEENYIKKNFNPYDASDIKIDAVIVSPSGIIYNRAAFWTFDYDININTSRADAKTYYDNELNGTDMAVKKSEGHFMVRFLPIDEAGIWNISLDIYQKGEQAFGISKNITVNESDTSYDGVIEVDDTNNRYFRYSKTKKTYIPVGQNVAWYTTSRKSYDYDVWYQKMREVGMNTSRVWMASWSFAIHIGTAAKIDNYTPRMAALARLDRVLELGEEYGINCILCLNNHGQFSDKVNPEWQSNPYNIKNGGILSSPAQFFINEEAKEIYKNELRYIIARFGAYKSILAYELFNEVDWTDTFNALNVSKWHEEMGSFIKDNDTYNHMITTSYKGEQGLAYSKDVISFTNPHSYGYSNKSIMTDSARLAYQNQNKYNKPVLFEEYGVNANSGNETYQVDKTGISIYQGLWGPLMNGFAGGAMVWWWDSYTHPYNMYKHYLGFSIFTKEMHLEGTPTFINKTNITISDSSLNFYGIEYSDRIYGYIYDKSYTYSNFTKNEFKDVSVTFNLGSGNYLIKIFDTTNNTFREENLSDNQITLDFINDFAFIIEKK